MRDIRPPILMLNSTPESEAIQHELQLSFLLDDIAAWGPEKVERVLRYSFPPFLWTVRVYDEFTYLIQAPSADWLNAATRKRWLRVEDAQFPILKWDPIFNAGKRLQSVWVRVYGFPMDKWVWGEFNGIFLPFGAIVLEIDPGTLSRYDYRFARIRIGIGNLPVLPRYHSLTHRDATGFVSNYELEFEVENDQTEPVNAWRGRLNGRPYPNGTPFGVVPAPRAQPVNNEALPPGEDSRGGDHNPQRSHLVNSGSTPMEEDRMPSNTVPHHIQMPPKYTLPPLHSTHILPTGPPVYQPSNGPHNTQGPVPPPAQPRLGLHGPSPQPPRQRGVVLSEPSPLLKPVLGHSPVGKGKAPLPSCSAEGKQAQGYETDDSDSDEDSFQNALNAIYQLERGAASTSTTQTSHSAGPSQTTSLKEGMVSDIDSAMMADAISTPVPLAHPISTASDSDSSSRVADIIDGLLDADPLSARAKKIQAKKKHSSIKNPKIQKIKDKKSVRFTTPPRSKTPPRKRYKSKSPSPSTQPKSNHVPRSTNKKTTPNSQSYPEEVIELSDIPIDFPPADTADMTQAEYSRQFTRPMPRRSYRFLMNSTHTPILKKAQKRKASGSAKPQGNPLLDSYPYLRFTVDQIHEMFRIYQIQLGSSSEDRDSIITGIRSMGRAQFEHLLKSLQGRNKNQDDLVCIGSQDLHSDSLILDIVGDNLVYL